MLYIINISLGKRRKKMSVIFEYSGHLSQGAIKVCEEIEWNANSVDEAWDLVKKSDYLNEIEENGFFRTCDFVVMDRTNNDGKDFISEEGNNVTLVENAIHFSTYQEAEDWLKSMNWHNNPDDWAVIKEY